ncbi:hypothetical protein F5Y05DRAFT_291765 [Hypoxylon sp. FL0543]|nr:hypothetical protein F5Y05DRAFT_291765 [Hypoxylon sp. FL0543]
MRNPALRMYLSSRLAVRIPLLPIPGGVFAFEHSRGRSPYSGTGAVRERLVASFSINSSTICLAANDTTSIGDRVSTSYHMQATTEIP